MGRPKRPLLDCPVCGVDTMPATDFYRKGEGVHDNCPDGWVWMNDDEHDCDCGAKLRVVADGETAYLVEALALPNEAASEQNKP